MNIENLDENQSSVTPVPAITSYEWVSEREREREAMILQSYVCVPRGVAEAAAVL